MTATYADATTACTSLGASLATITTADQDTAVNGLMSGSVDCWIGLNDAAVDQSFVWTEDSSALGSYTNWYGSNPAAHATQNCVKKKANQNGQWDDVGCGKTLNYACSMVASCGVTTTAFATTTVQGSTA